MPDPAPDYSTWTLEQLMAKYDELVFLICWAKAKKMPVTELRDEADKITAAMNQMME